MALWNDVPLETYLNSRYRPDCDYVDGTLQGRNTCVRPHPDAVGALHSQLRTQAEGAGLHVALSYRVRISETRYRVADLCVGVRGDDSAPILVVEVLSPEQTLDDMAERVGDYSVAGIRDIWLYDPARRLAWMMQDGQLVPKQGTLVACDGAVRVDLRAVNEDVETTWPLVGSEERLRETLALLAAEKVNRPAGWFFSEENQDIFS